MNPSFKTDFYELTQVAAALADGTAHRDSVFEVFSRRLPEGRRYGVLAGVDRVVEAISNFTFGIYQINWLRKNTNLSEETLEYLLDFKFRGKVIALPEGSVYFPHTPLMMLEGTFAECVLLETVILSILNFDSAVSSAASRMFNSARRVDLPSIPLFEMGSRRAHEAAAVDAARAAYIGGFAGTSNIEAAMAYGIPVIGTSAHAFTLLHDSETDAFKSQIKTLGNKTTLLVDTYDIQQGVRNAVEIGGSELGGIRIDSGDLHMETVKARKLLDDLGAPNAKIVLSSDMDEYTLSELVERGTPVDTAGVGTRVVTGSGHPTSSMVYKIVSRRNDEGVMESVEKKADGKGHPGGAKTLYRIFDDAGILVDEKFKIVEDLSAQIPNSVFELLIENGEVVNPITAEEATMKARKRHLSDMSHLPEIAKSITAGKSYIESSLDS